MNIKTKKCDNPATNIICIGGTYGGYGGPSGMYYQLDNNKIYSSIYQVHTSTDIKLAIRETINAIDIISNNEKLPIILLGWSMGGCTVIRAIENMVIEKNPFIKLIKACICISSRPEETDYLSQMKKIRKYIICGALDTERRTNGSKKMFAIASEPKSFFEIPNGTHNFENQDCYNNLYGLINSILQFEVNKFL